MDKKKIKIGILFAAALLGAAYMDQREQGLDGDNRIQRQPAGQGGQEYVLNLEAEGVMENYAYTLKVEEELPDGEQTLAYLHRAEAEIEESFWPEGEDSSGVTRQVRMEESYADGTVEAEWSFDRYDVIDPEGNPLEDKIPEDGAVVTAYAELSCYGMQELYQFSFLVLQREKSEGEQLLADIRTYIDAQLEKTGESYLQLPTQIDGVSLTWTIPKPHYAGKILLLEAALLIGLKLAEQERRKKREEERKLQMKLDYPDIVSKILVLTGAGMSVKQAWSRICSSYLRKKESGRAGVRPAYEEMLLTDRKMTDGEGERTALQKFGEQTEIGCYHRFSRLLAEHLQKGVRGLDGQLEREAENAFEERKQIARKLGEEAGTKMLLPMIFMLGIVLAIVLVPALIGFGN